MSKFRSILLSQRWAQLHKERQDLMKEKKTEKIENKIDLLSSLMSSCKAGFLLPDAKVKKAIKFLKAHTNKNRVRYGTLAEGEKSNTILFKDIVLLYTDKDDQILFREHNEEK